MFIYYSKAVMWFLINGMNTSNSLCLCYIPYLFSGSDEGLSWLNVIFACHMTESHGWPTCYSFCFPIHWVKNVSNKNATTRGYVLCIMSMRMNNCDVLFLQRVVICMCINQKPNGEKCMNWKTEFLSPEAGSLNGLLGLLWQLGV